MNNILRYRGYIAKPQYSVDDNFFYGKILGIKDLVDFHADNTKELVNEFHRAVDCYIEYCKEIGKKPQKTYSGRINIRIDPELHQRIFEYAVETGQSLTKAVAEAIENRCDSYDEAQRFNNRYR